MKRLERFAPWFFVLIWSQGFLVAKYAFRNSDVIYFLSIRLFIAAGLLAIITKIAKQSLRLSRSDFISTVIIGLALHALYLGGVWHAIALGSPSGIASVITSLQPVFVSLIAISLLHEPLVKRQYLGLAIGFIGVVLVVAPSLERRNELTAASLIFLILALVGSTSATLMQKKIGHQIPLLAGTTYQFLIAAFVLSVISIATDKTSITWNIESVAAMFWAVVVTSLIAILLLLWMLSQSSAARVSSLLYLVPPATAVQAYLLFDEKLNAQGIVGIGATALGVALVQKR